ncbi:MAG: CinA family protein [Sedimentisphaerales bacterium]|nr:CinA family protein [Sedimentisphaerales bacterium]
MIRRIENRPVVHRMRPLRWGPSLVWSIVTLGLLGLSTASLLVAVEPSGPAAPAVTAETTSPAKPPQTAETAVRYMIVVTGGELLAGVYPDGHTCFITRTLRPLGLDCVGSLSVDDKREDLLEAFRFAAGKAPLVIVTGGLGPTDNDITRQVLSEFTGIALQESLEVLAELSRRFQVPPERLAPNLRRQTQVPVGGTFLPNRQGTAVGLVFERPGTVLVALPGPPAELQAMVREELIGYLSRRFGTRRPGASLTLRFVGLGQSQIDQTIKEHLTVADDITTASQFEGGRVDFTFSLAQDDPQSRARLESLKRQILTHLGEYVYATDATSLEETVCRLLKQRKSRLVLVEAASGGGLAAALSTVADANVVLAGAYVGLTDEALGRLLGVGTAEDDSGLSGRQRLERLARAAADATGSGMALVVGQVRSEPGGANGVEVLLLLPDGSNVSRSLKAGSESLARLRLVSQLLDLLRRGLI